MKRKVLSTAVIAVFAATGVAIGGCGGASDDDGARDAQDARTAAKLRDDAARFRAEAARRERANEQAELNESRARTAPDGTVTVAESAGAAGSAEIEDAAAPKPGAGGSAGRRPLFTSADRASFDRLAAQLGGESGIAVSGLGRNQKVVALGSVRETIAWSTSKVPVAMAVVAKEDAGAHAADLRQALAASDNAAAERLWLSLGGGDAAAAAANAQLRASGDEHTRIQADRVRAGFTAFGQTLWALTDQVRFTAGMVCTRAGVAALRFMGQVVSAHRWGLGTIPGEVQIKGGWGPGSSPGAAGPYQDRQMGIVPINGRRVAVAIATRPADGTHESGTAHLTAIAKWLVSHLDVAAAPARPACG